MKNQTKSVFCYLLMITMAFQALSGLWGGLILMIYPSGKAMQLPLSFLANTPFNNFFIPGMILFLFIGVFPAYVTFLLVGSRQFNFLNKLNIYQDMQQAWTFSLFAGIISVLWMDFQIMLIGYGHYIQSIYAFIGVIIIMLTLVPSVKNYYREKRAVQ